MGMQASVDGVSLMMGGIGNFHMMGVCLRFLQHSILVK
jgi:hypothetical protein